MSFLNYDIFGRGYTKCPHCGHRKAIGYMRICEKCGQVLQKGRRWGLFLIPLAIFMSFKNIKIDENHLFTGILWIASLFLVPWLYYRTRTKIKFINNERAKNFIFGVLLTIVAIFLVGFLGALGDRFILNAPPDSAVQDRDALVQLNQSQKTFLSDFQNRWDESQKDIDEQTDSKFGYMNNVAGYKALQKLNDERYGQLIDYSNQASPILAKYSSNLVDAFSQLVKAGEKSKDVYNEIFLAKINYFQALLDNESESRIDAKRLIVNNAVDKLSEVEQEATQAQNNWQKVYNDFFGS